MFIIAYAPPPIAPCVIALVIAAASTDIQCRRIPNVLVAAGLLGALFVQCWLRGIPVGAATWLAGAVVGFGLFLPLYLLRGMAAGDVKLLAMVGAWTGPLLVSYVALATCVIGGVWVLTVTVRRRQLKKLFVNVFILAHPALRGGRIVARGGEPAAIESVGSVPYGVAIAAGTVVVLLATAA
ncbi:prepilin peptidase [Caballeronia sp. SEWSISQ10-4 2]|uniref:A24 family peptidase n=1 Tax=Caballeronia sp. SEWSISQ10-4 2 TaxID=2937438 RepID=UPI002653434E|nr:prepilin peptidase [Caballeronia sp. SEWSISQ10-4 2]MDN7183092.1 prepilin peptidase [Caballeronia sp. SEWSISQ10-4 2]